MNTLDLIIAVVCLSFLGLAFYLLRGHRSHVKIVSYRRLYIQNIARLEILTVQLNQLSNLAHHIKNDGVLATYEEAVKMLEALLTAISKIPPLADKGELVRSMEPMVADLESRLNLCRELFRKELAPKKELNQLFKAVVPENSGVRGCYFCSKPFSPKSFRRVVIKFQGKKMDVFTCSSCRAELKSRREVDILHFVHKQRTIHWSDLPGYDPKTDFWTLGSRNPKHKRPKLELIREYDNNE